MTALKVVHPTQPYGPQAALLAKRADVVGELEAMSRKLAKLAEAQRAEEAVFDEIRRLSEDVGGPPSARRPLSDQIAVFSCGATIQTAYQDRQAICRSSARQSTGTISIFPSRPTGKRSVRPIL
jgi:hypothetical protein